MSKVANFFCHLPGFSAGANEKSIQVTQVIKKN